MASKITDSTYLQVELADESGEFTRLYRIDNPADSVTTKAIVSEAFEPAFAKVNDELGTYFQDDATDAYLTQVKSVTRVAIRKTETPFA